MEIEDIPTIDYFNTTTQKSSIYYPDIFVKSKDLIIEVKSMWTYNKDKQKNKDKWRETSLIYNFEAWIYKKVKGDMILFKRYEYKQGEKIMKRFVAENGEQECILYMA